MAVSRIVPDAVDKTPVGQTGGAAKQVLSLEASGQGAVPVAGGCEMPASKSAANPFFGNIRQNMDLLDGVGQMPIKRPAGLSKEAEQRLPRWLREGCNSEDQGKLVSEKFLAIEKVRHDDVAVADQIIQMFLQNRHQFSSAFAGIGSMSVLSRLSSLSNS